jgi:diguanylate cyclase
LPKNNDTIIKKYCKVDVCKSMKLLSDLFINLCILVMLLSAFNLLSRKKKGFISPTINTYRRVHFGINMGLMGIVLMYYTIHFDGTIVDLRQIPIIIAALYGGALPSIIASILIAVGRISLYGVNNASIFASVLIILIGFSCGVMSKIRLGLVKKLLTMNITNLILTSIVFFLLTDDKTILMKIYISYWSVSLVGGFSVICLMEYMRRSKEQLQSAQENADRDFLTGLYNVRKFDELLKESLRKSDKHNEQLSMILIDIDYFKQINDKFGHQSGDEVLKQLSKIFRDSCRSIDIPSRIGGEEFSVILPSCGRNQASEVAERIRSAVEIYNFILPTGSFIKVTISLGISTTCETINNHQELIKQADDCLYQAKSTGRNKSCSSQMI